MNTAFRKDGNVGTAYLVQIHGDTTDYISKVNAYLEKNGAVAPTDATSKYTIISEQNELVSGGADYAAVQTQSYELTTDIAAGTKINVICVFVENGEVRVSDSVSAVTVGGTAIDAEGNESPVTQTPSPLSFTSTQTWYQAEVADTSDPDPDPDPDTGSDPDTPDTPDPDPETPPVPPSSEIPEVRLTAVFAEADDGTRAEGSLSGAKTYKLGAKASIKAKAAKGSLFAGWYWDEDCNYPYNEEVDYRTPTLSVKMESVILHLYGKFVLADAENGKDSLTITWPKDDAEESDYDAVYDVDTDVVLPVEIDSLALPKVSVKGLPKGLKWNSKTFTITGKPTTPGVYIVTMTATNTQVKKGTPQTFKMRINNVNDLFGEDYDEVDTVIEVNAGLDVGDLDLPEALVAAIKTAGAKVKGLPSGLKWNAKKGCFEGWVKTVKAGKEFYTVTFSVGKVVTTLTFKVNNQIGLGVALEEKTYTVYRGEKTELNAVSDALTVCYDDDKKHKLDVENLTVKATGLPKGLSLKYNKSAQAYEITGTTKATAGTYPLTLSVTDKRLKLKQEKVEGLTIEVEDVPGELAGDFYAMDVDNGLYVAINRPKGLGGKAVIETGAKKYTLSFCASLEENDNYHAYYKKGTRISENLPAVDLAAEAMTISLPDGTTVELSYEKKVDPSPDLVRKNEPFELDDFTDATLSIDKNGNVTVKATNADNKKVTLKGVLLEDKKTIYLFAKPDTFIEYSLID